DYSSPNVFLATSNNGTATLHGDGGDDTIMGSPGAETIDGGQGDDTINGGGGVDHVLGVNSASVVHITNTTTDGALVLDMSGRQETLTFWLPRGQICVRG